MPYALNRANALSSALADLNIPAPTAAGGQYDYEIEFVMQVFATGDFFIGPTNGSLFVVKDSLFQEHAGGSNRYWGNQVTPGWDARTSKVKFRWVTSYDGATHQTSFYVDGALYETKSSSAAFAALWGIRYIGLYTELNRGWAFDYFKFTDRNNAASDRHFLNNTAPTGLIWTDISANGVDAVLTGDWVDDGSQWVAYAGTDPAITVTQASLTPGGTISGTTANYATTPTVLSVSEGTNRIGSDTGEITGLTITPGATGVYDWTATMPVLPTTGSATGIRFTDAAIVELT